MRFSNGEAVRFYMTDYERQMGFKYKSDPQQGACGYITDAGIDKVRDPRVYRVRFEGHKEITWISVENLKKLSPLELLAMSAK